MNPRKLSVQERFWSKVDKSPNPTDCWLWTAGMGPNGYGYFWFGQLGIRYCASHRAAWILTNGVIPKGLSVCHKCDVPQCVRPDHLYLATQSENWKEMRAKGRGRWWCTGKLPKLYPVTVKKTLIEKFLSRIDKTSDPNGCWLWTGCKRSSGYGKFYVNGSPVSAHRLTWMLFNGKIPEGMWVLHRCDVRACVNPDHLFLGTVADNIADCEKKGRGNHPVGERSGHTPFTTDQVREIRAKYQWFKMGYAKLAKMYGVHENAIFQIVKRQTWKHI